MSTPVWTHDDVLTGVEAALASGWMTGNDENQPTAYIVNAERVQQLVEAVIEAVAPGIAERAVQP